MVYSKNDLYPNISEQLTTVEQTIPETEENKLESVGENAEGMKEISPVPQVWSTIIVMVLFVILLGMIE